MKRTPKTHYALQISSYPPRECGIATFTQNLVTEMNKHFNPTLKSRVIALNEDPTTLYKYDGSVIDNVPATNLEHYVALAKKINRRDDVKIVNIQHEFGLFGGAWGNYLIPFLQVLEKPAVVTLHSVLPHPDGVLKKTMRLIGVHAQSLVVMNKISGAILERDYAIPRAKISYIPHGIPNTPFEAGKKAKAELGLENNIVLSTFGLMSPNKGIEYAIRALPKIVKRFPEVRYIIVGATHPIVRRGHGEAYRNNLRKEVERLKLGRFVHFYNKYLSTDELLQVLKATDIYLAPNTDPNQSVSGALSYALGCGRPVVSARSAYARHVIKKDYGILVSPRNAREITAAVVAILQDPKRMRDMGASAYESTRQMTWPNVARAYHALYKKVSEIGEPEHKLPKIKLDHMERLTNGFGMAHFAKYAEPTTRYGYSLDDNARALLAAAQYAEIAGSDARLEGLMRIYLNFIRFTQRADGTFANIVTKGRKRDTTRDEDVQGRAIWALAFAANSPAVPEEIRRASEKMFNKSLGVASRLGSPRAIAFAMTGLFHLQKNRKDAAIRDLFLKMAEKQAVYYQKNATGDWDWFENHLTYSNSKLSESLYYSYLLTKNKTHLQIAERTLNFLSRITFQDGRYVPIGQNGWYFRDQKRAYFDQQPEDTASMVQTKLVAYRATRNRKHLRDAMIAFEWFLGRNHLGQSVYDEVTGGCQDGVGQRSINLNQGAESTVSYLLARLAFEEPGVKGAL